MTQNCNDTNKFLKKKTKLILAYPHPYLLLRWVKILFDTSHKHYEKINNHLFLKFHKKKKFQNNETALLLSESKCTLDIPCSLL